MQLEMVKIHVLGHRRRLDEVLDVLYRQGTVHLVDVTQDRDVRLPPLSLDEHRVRHARCHRTAGSGAVRPGEPGSRPGTRT